MIEIQVLDQTASIHQSWILNQYIIDVPIPLTSFVEFAGCDSGSVNMGLAKLYSVDDKDRAMLWQMKLERSSNPIERIRLAADIWFKFYKAEKPDFLTIENAAYAKGFRQVELAEQRAIIAWLCMIDVGYNQVQMVAPMTIRKKVFSSGKIKAHEAWQLAGIPKNKQPSDALAALSCAYYGMMKGE